MILIFPTEHEGCRRHIRERERERARENSLNLSRCISHDSVEGFHHMPNFPYFVSTNHEVQTLKGAPHQLPILQMNPSTCHWYFTARGEEWKQKQTSNELHSFLTGGWGSSSHLMKHQGCQNNKLYLVVEQGCYMDFLFSHSISFWDRLIT